MIRPALLFCFSLLVFANTFHHPFVHDDIVFIVQNKNIARWDDLPRVFLGGPQAAAASNINTYYRPLLEIVYRLEYHLFGLYPSGWHMFNAAVHGINGVLAYRLLALAGFLTYRFMGGHGALLETVLLAMHGEKETRSPQWSDCTYLHGPRTVPLLRWHP